MQELQSTSRRPQRGTLLPQVPGALSGSPEPFSRGHATWRGGISPGCSFTTGVESCSWYLVRGLKGKQQGLGKEAVGGECGSHYPSSPCLPLLALALERNSISQGPGQGCQCPSPLCP